MTQLGIFLNELSVGTQFASNDDACTSMSRFVETLRIAHKRFGSFALQTPQQLKHLEVGKDFPVSMWLNSRDVRDEWRFLLTLMNRAPFDSGYQGYRDKLLGVDYSVGSTKALGLGWAHLAEGISISFDDFDGTWDSSSVELERIELHESSDGTLTDVVQSVNVRHLLSPAHVHVHADWVSNNYLHSLDNFDAFWQQREALFPHLKFLPAVEGMLRHIPFSTPQFRAICERLVEMNESVGSWDTSGDEGPAWKSRVTGEFENRKRLCYFTDELGNSDCYYLHARFTPGAGRIHFLLRSELKIAVIAHIGDKLPD